jgi:hypothetical protein
LLAFVLQVLAFVAHFLLSFFRPSARTAR